jgi:hypothetical protein
MALHNVLAHDTTILTFIIKNTTRRLHVLLNCTVVTYCMMWSKSGAIFLATGFAFTGRSAMPFYDAGKFINSDINNYLQQNIRSI